MKNKIEMTNLRENKLDVKIILALQREPLLILFSSARNPKHAIHMRLETKNCHRLTDK